MSQRLILIRGLPGSGKSTLARSYIDRYHKWFEADLFFLRPDGTYDFNPDLVGKAHSWCQKQVETELRHGFNVLVSNTFTRQWEMEPYRKMAKALDVELLILVAGGKWQNIHGVPEDVIQRMRDRWED